MTSEDSKELQRQKAIDLYQLASAARESVFDDVTKLAAEIFGVPSALVTVLTENKQVFGGACGLEGPGTERGVAFCNHTVRDDSVFVVEDAAADHRFKNNPLVTGPPFIRFYAGAPLKVGGAVPIGSLCLIDHQPRTFDKEAQNRLQRLAKTVTDLMELRLGSRLADERQQELADQAELLRATVDHVQQGIAVFDHELKLVLWNQQLTDMLGVPQELCEAGCNAAELLLATAQTGSFGPGNPEEIVAGLLLSIRTTPSRRLELLGPDGRILLAWRAAIPDGRSILTIEDITEQRRIARMKDEFVSTVSHELRTPLTAIVGALAVLSRKSADSLEPASRKMLDMAVRNSERLSQLINDILDIEKLGSGILAMRRDRIDLTEVLRDSVEHNMPFAERHGVDLKLDLGTLVTLPVLGDHGRLLQAVTNLVSNACKFSPVGATVEIEAERQQSTVLIRVRDQGSGIPAEFRPQLFRRFAQADPANTKGKASGTGLGLSITKAIVERHQGTIDFSSEPGQGTCFWIRLPILVEKAT